jgi:ubiquinone/menaquinone biosynthesis C-methylase UbiE
VGAESDGVTKAALGELVTQIAAAEGYRLWSASYDRDLNPLLALEARVLGERLGSVAGACVVDAATGTGRWMEWARSRGACVFGVDLSPQMLAAAAAKTGLAGRVILADICALPFPSAFADLAICSFAAGYLPSIAALFHEMARVARRVVVSDLHPAAAQAGWTRSFRSGGATYELRQFQHSKLEIEDCARAARLTERWTVEAAFDEPERGIFESAGKGSNFAALRRFPAVLISAWERE